MNTLKIKQLIVTLWIAFVLTISSGIVPTQQLGLNIVPQAHACEGLHSGGGGC